MSLRSSVAAALLLAFVMETPNTARAQEVPAPVDGPADTPAAVPTIVTEVLPALPLIVPSGARLHLAAQPPLPRIALFAPAPEEIRLSHGAKVAIIVSAIVVGSLVVLGLVVFSRPGHL